ncbi:MAG TPA: lysophospholipid acyltransferase family protein, partial [Nocardioides sp.]
MADRVYDAVNLLGRALLRALNIRVEAHGTEHLPLRGPVLLASNHVSYPDFVFVQKAAFTTQPHIRFMCRHDVWDRRLLARAMDNMGHIPVDRRAPAGAYLRARSLLRAREWV